ncbi:MAG: hypothetical protein H6Q07_158 [Acidobacteria bacterium]|jgi:hypothetical protein|nr:hypothetical protein [Acidobacteriota bacterium]
MGGLGVTEFFLMLFAALIKVGIPLAIAIWMITALRRIRADNEAIKSKLEAIEQQLRRNIQN